MLNSELHAVQYASKVLYLCLAIWLFDALLWLDVTTFSRTLISAFTLSATILCLFFQYRQQYQRSLLIGYTCLFISSCCHYFLTDQTLWFVTVLFILLLTSVIPHHKNTALAVSCLLSAIGLSLISATHAIDPDQINQALITKPVWSELLLSASLLLSAFALLTLRNHTANSKLDQEDTNDTTSTVQNLNLNAITNHLYLAVIEVDDEWTVTSINRFDCHRAEILQIKEGENLLDHFHPQDRSAYLFSASLDEMGSLNSEFRLISSNNTHWYRLTGGLNQESACHSTRWLIGLQCIDNEVNARQKIADMARFESLSELCGGLAHDFNNLLTVIGVYAELLPQSKEQQGITKAQQQATELTRSLLAFARRQESNVEIININSVINELKPIIRGLVPESISIQWTLIEHPCNIAIDVMEFKQSIINVVVNARDAIVKDGEITISTTRHPGKTQLDPTYFHVNIKDNGKGMNESTRQRAAEPFFTTKDRTQGTGLGLSLVHGIVSRYGGILNIDSTEHNGAMVSIGFPCSYFLLDDCNSMAASLPQNQTLQGKNLKALLVEDRDVLRTALTTTLEKAGVLIYSAANAEQAHEYINNGNCVDILITDIVMPGSKGHELASEVRLKKPSLPVLFMSGYTSEDVSVPDSQRKITSFIAKPFSTEMLINHIDTLMQQSEAINAECKKNKPHNDEATTS